MPLPFETKKDPDVVYNNKEDRALDVVSDFVKQSSRYREPFLEKVKEAYDLYRNHSQIKYSKAVQKANLKLPKAHHVVWSLIPALVQRFTASRPYIKVIGRSWEDDIAAKLITEHFSYQLDQMDFKSKYPAFLLDYIVGGTAFTKMPYIFKEKLVMKSSFEPIESIDPMTGMPTVTMERSKEESVEVVFDGPDFQHVPFEDIYPDWTIKTPGDIQSMRGIVHRVYRSLEELKAQKRKTLADGSQVGVYKNLDKLEYKILERQMNQDENENFREEMDDLDGDTKNADLIELWEYWGKFSVDGKSAPKEYLIVVANKDVVIRMEENPYDMRFKPFVAAVNTPISGEFYGDGDIMPIASLIKEQTALRNARLDQVNISLNNMYLVDRTAGINTRTLAFRPGGLIFTNDINGIKPLSNPDVNGSSYRDTQQIDYEMQEASGTFSASQQSGNIGKAFSRTATGVSFLQNATGARIDFKIQMLDSMLFTKMGWIMLMHNRQFADDETVVRIYDPQVQAEFGNVYQSLPADAFMRPYDFVIESSINTQFDFEKLQAFAQWAQTAEQSQPGTIKFDKLLQAIGDFLVGNKLPNFVRSDQERMMMQQQQLAQQQAVNGSIGRNTPQPNAGANPIAEMAMQ